MTDRVTLLRARADELEKLHLAAQKAPWAQEISMYIWDASGSDVAETQWSESAALIVALRNAAPAIIATLRALAERVAEAERCRCDQCQRIMPLADMWTSGDQPIAPHPDQQSN